MVMLIVFVMLMMLLNVGQCYDVEDLYLDGADDLGDVDGIDVASVDECSIAKGFHFCTSHWMDEYYERMRAQIVKALDSNCRRTSWRGHNKIYLRLFKDGHAVSKLFKTRSFGLNIHVPI